MINSHEMGFYYIKNLNIIYITGMPYNPEYYQKNKAKFNESAKKYRAKHKEAMNEKLRKLYHEHSDERIEYAKQRYAENADKIKEYQRNRRAELKRPYICECGTTIQENSKYFHLRSNKHAKLLAEKANTPPINLAESESLESESDGDGSPIIKNDTSSDSGSEYEYIEVTDSEGDERNIMIG